MQKRRFIRLLWAKCDKAYRIIVCFMDSGLADGRDLGFYMCVYVFIFKLTTIKKDMEGGSPSGGAPIRGWTGVENELRSV